MSDEMIPDGYYVFRFKAQWAVGGYDEPAEKKEVIIRKVSLDAAIGAPYRHLRFLRETCFWDFTVEDCGGIKRLSIDSHLGYGRSMLSKSALFEQKLTVIV